MVRVGKFLDDCRPELLLVDGTGIRIISPETRGRIVVAPKSHVVELESVRIDEFSSPLLEIYENVLCFRVRRHPKAVEVANPVPFFVGFLVEEYLCIIFNDDITCELLVVPKRSTFRRNDISCATIPGDGCLWTFRLDCPVFFLSRGNKDSEKEDNNSKNSIIHKEGVLAVREKSVSDAKVKNNCGSQKKIENKMLVRSEINVEPSGGGNPATIEQLLRFQKSSVVNELKKHFAVTNISELAVKLSKQS